MSSTTSRALLLQRSKSCSDTESGAACSGSLDLRLRGCAANEEAGAVEILDRSEQLFGVLIVDELRKCPVPVEPPDDIECSLAQPATHTDALRGSKLRRHQLMAALAVHRALLQPEAFDRLEPHVEQRAVVGQRREIIVRREDAQDVIAAGSDWSVWHLVDAKPVGSVAAAEDDDACRDRIDALRGEGVEPYLELVRERGRVAGELAVPTRRIRQRVLGAVVQEPHVAACALEPGARNRGGVFAGSAHPVTQDVPVTAIGEEPRDLGHDAA